MKSDADKVIKDQEEAIESQENKDQEDLNSEAIEAVQEDPKDKRIVELELQAKRYLADYQNLQRRTQEQKIEWIRSGNRELLLKVLPVLDTLVLASKHTQDKGIELSLHQFFQVLESAGVTRIKTDGEAFNPHLMEAIGTTEGEDGKVIEEVRAGFMLNDQVLRSAQVIVGKKE